MHVENRDPSDERREFLKKCGRFAVVTPPAMALLLSVSTAPKQAFASSIGRGGDDDSQGNEP
jgi:hypothetical protein